MVGHGTQSEPKATTPLTRAEGDDATYRGEHQRFGTEGRLIAGSGG